MASIIDTSAWTSTFATTLQVFWFIIWTLIIGAGAWLGWRMIQYKIRVTVHKVLGDNSIREMNVKARLDKKNNELVIALDGITKGFKKRISNPPPDFWVNTKKGEKLYLRWDGASLFVPQKVVYNSPLNFEPAQYNILTQMALRIKNREERHGKKTFWGEYGTVVAWGVFVILTAVTMWVLFAKLGVVAESINNLAGALKESVQTIK